MAKDRSMPAAPDAVPSSPIARRTRVPRWLDIKLLAGIVIIIASVIIGARVVSSAEQSQSVWAVTNDLAAGTTLTEADVTTIDVRLSESASSYVGASVNPVGQVLNRDVSAGDLLPAKALGAADGEVSLALSVPAANVPVSVARGDRVTLYATNEPTPGAVDPAATLVIVEAVTVEDVSARSQGALSVGTGDLQVVIKVPSCAVSTILQGTTAKVLTVVEVAPGATRNAGCA